MSGDGRIPHARSRNVAIDAGRRRLLRAAATMTLAAVASALAAQDARSFGAQSAARKWLALTDQLDAAKSWDAADDKFRKSMAQDKWTAVLKRIRAPLGPIVQRAAISTRFEKSMKGFPPGDYALVVFRSAFAKKTDSKETVTLDRDSDGTWRVVGYAIG